MSSFPEIVIIVVIIFIVFGVGRVQQIGSELVRAKKELKSGYDGTDGRQDVIDITPGVDSNEPSYDPKPGTRRDPIEDAEVEGA